MNFEEQNPQYPSMSLINKRLKVMFKFDDDEPTELCEAINKFTLELEKNNSNKDNGIDNNGTAFIEFKSNNGKKFTLYIESDVN